NLPANNGGAQTRLARTLAPPVARSLDSCCSFLEFELSSRRQPRSKIHFETGSSLRRASDGLEFSPFPDRGGCCRTRLPRREFGFNQFGDRGQSGSFEERVNRHVHLEVFADARNDAGNQQRMPPKIK